MAIVDEAQCRGLSLNFDTGKTELLVHWRGSGTRSVKEKISATGGTMTVTGDGPPISLRCTFSYKHLGTWVQNNAIHHRDSRVRLTEAHKAWGPLLRPVFRKRNIGVSTKRQIFEALVYSRLLYNAHVWTCPASEEIDKWANGVRAMLYSVVGPLLRGLPPFQFSLETLCGLAGLITPFDALHVARLRYFRRWILGAPTVLWNLLATIGDGPGSWLQALRELLPMVFEILWCPLPLDFYLSIVGLDHLCLHRFVLEGPH